MAPRHYFLLQLIALFLLSVSADDQLPANRTTTTARNGRVFSIFSIVQFPNAECTSTSGTYTSGTCFTSDECTSKGGSAAGTCAAGFGMCCIFTVSASGSTITENCTYITNPNFPSSYVATSTPATLTYTIAKCQDDICRIRLDYESFILTQPITPAATEGQCTADRLEFTTTGQTVGPGDNANGYGNYPYLCGTNSGLHSYLDLSLTSTDTAKLTFTIGDAILNLYKIKVSQLSCSDNNVSQQQQCFQYFTGQTGTFSSYNYVGAQLLAYTQYNACIRQEADHCCIQWSQLTSTTFRAAGGRADVATGTACLGTGTATLCSDVVGCSFDYVFIPNSGAEIGLQTSTAASERYCGPALSPLNADRSAPVISCTLPFTIGHVTGVVSVGGTAARTSPNSQFQLTYSQLPGTC